MKLDFWPRILTLRFLQEYWRFVSSKNINSRKPWSSGFGRRLMSLRLWVWIPLPYTGRIFITYIYRKNFKNKSELAVFGGWFVRLIGISMGKQKKNFSFHLFGKTHQTFLLSQCSCLPEGDSVYSGSQFFVVRSFGLSPMLQNFSWRHRGNQDCLLNGNSKNRTVIYCNKY